MKVSSVLRNRLIFGRTVTCTNMKAVQEIRRYQTRYVKLSPTRPAGGSSPRIISQVQAPGSTVIGSCYCWYRMPKRSDLGRAAETGSRLIHSFDSTQIPESGLVVKSVVTIVDIWPPNL